MEPKRFQKNQEDFICENCGVAVSGNGYTNHCPQCLWSKHVDVHPGDRAAECHGLMEPVGMVIEDGMYFIVHQCKKCPHQRRNKKSPEDNFDTLVAIS